jgi:hypothetical protein
MFLSPREFVLLALMMLASAGAARVAQAAATGDASPPAPANSTDAR